MKRERMSSKERWLATVQMKPVDRLPFWPKLDAAYPRAQQGTFRGADLGELHDWIGSDKHSWIRPVFREVRSRTSLEVSTQGNLRRTAYRTPHGETELITRFDEASQAWHPVHFPVRYREDLQVMTAFYEDTVVELDPEALAHVQARRAELGEGGLLCSSVGKSPLMHRTALSGTK